MGYLRPPSGEVVKDPDAQAQTVIELVFAQFERGVLRYLVVHAIRRPCRAASGPNKGELTWQQPNRVMPGPMSMGADLPLSRQGGVNGYLPGAVPHSSASVECARCGRCPASLDHERLSMGPPL